MFSKSDKEQKIDKDKITKAVKEQAQKNLSEQKKQDEDKQNQKPQAKTASRLKIRNWYSNRYQMVVVQRNILLLFTLASMVAVTIAVIFVQNIMSSKSLEPYVIEVESKTGVPVVVEQLSSRHLTGDEMIKKYFINKFVHGSSGYDPKTYRMDSTTIRLFSTPNVFNEFRARINARELGPDSEINVRIKSVQFPGANTAQIRIARNIRRDGFSPVIKNEIITMDFYFADIKLSLEERLVNPLGFQVSRYLVAEEIFNF